MVSCEAWCVRVHFLGGGLEQLDVPLLNAIAVALKRHGPHLLRREGNICIPSRAREPRLRLLELENYATGHDRQRVKELGDVRFDRIEW